MAVLAGATSNPKSFASGNAPTTLTTAYTAPTQSPNVTAPSATAYIKEIALCNTTTGAITVNVTMNGVYLINGLTLNANDTKVMGNLNTMMPASSTIQIGASAAGLNYIISGTEVQ